MNGCLPGNAPIANSSLDSELHSIFTFPAVKARFLYTKPPAYSVKKVRRLRRRMVRHRLVANTFRNLMFAMLLCGATAANAGKHPFQPLSREISHHVIDILMRHGMPVSHNKENGWYYLSSGTDAWIGGNPSFTILLFKGNEIPREAQLEIIRYCMDLYELQYRRVNIGIKIRAEPFKPELFRPKPYFELKFHAMPPSR